MTKKKSKNKQMNHERQKIEAAHNKKDYFRRFRHVTELIHTDLFNAINKAQLEVLYMVRGKSVKIIPDGQTSKEVVQFANEYANMVQQEKTIPLIDGGSKVSLREYFQIVLPMELLLVPPSDADLYPNIKKLVGVPWYDQYRAASRLREDSYYREMDHLRSAIRIFMSDLRYMIFYVDSDLRTSDLQSRDHRMHPEISIRTHRILRKKIRLPNGEVRSGIRVTFASPGYKCPENDMFIPISVPAVKFGITGKHADKKLPLYVTEHALNRLEERTNDIRFKGYTQMSILSAFSDSKAEPNAILPITKLGDKRMLLEYKLFGLKIGYLVVSIPYGVILVHTFLLMTSSSTPEGKILHEQLGLQKLDNQYLGIDKLTTFVNSDILDNEDICNLFREANCESLIEFCKKERSYPTEREDDNEAEEQIQLAARVREYLKKDQEEWEIPDDNQEEWAIPDDDQENEQMELLTDIDD
jgi:hypothetical protein